MEGDMRQRILAGLPMRSRRIEAGGVSTAVLEGGEGPPLVLLHGGIQVGAAVWFRAAPLLARSNRLVAPDLPGLGESEPLESLDPPTVIRWLDDVVGSTTDEAPVLVAHSLLGVFALNYASRRPERLRGLVVVDSPGLGPFRPAPGLVLALIRAMARPSPGSLRHFMGRILHDIDELEAQEGNRWEAFMDYLATLAVRPSVKATMRRLPKGNLGRMSDEFLTAVDVPVTVIWGRHDPNTRLSGAQPTIERLGWPIHIVEEAGHIPHLERPEQFARALASVVT